MNSNTLEGDIVGKRLVDSRWQSALCVNLTIELYCIHSLVTNVDNIVRILSALQGRALYYNSSQAITQECLEKRIPTKAKS